MPLRDIEHLKQEAADAHTQGNFGDAVDLLTRAIKQCAARELRTEMEEAKRRRLLSTLLSNRAAVYAQQSRFTHSLADASAAIQMDAGWPKPYLRQATALLGLGQPHAALQALDRGVVACSPPGTLAPETGGDGAPPAQLQQLARSNSAPAPPEAKDVWQLLSVRADVEVAALAQQKAAKRLRAIPHLHGSKGGDPGKAGGGGGNRASSNGAAAAGGHKRVALMASNSNVEAAVQGGPRLIAHCLDLLDAAAHARGLQHGAQPDAARVGVTVISGFLGAGKTTLLSRLLAEGPAALGAPAGSNGKLSNGGGAEAKPLRFGVVVNDMAAVNIDGILLHDTSASTHALEHMVATNANAAAAVGSSGAHGDGGEAPLNGKAAVGRKRDHATMQGAAPGGGEAQELDAVDHLVELSNGCICCGLKGDMLLAVSQLLATAPDINYLVIESTGVGQPMPIAAAFSSPDHRGRTLLDYVRLDCLVTVVDTPRFQAHLRSSHVPTVASDLALAAATGGPAAPAAAGNGGGGGAADGQAEAMLVEEEDRRPLAELLAEQVEFADVVLLNKAEMCGGGDGHHALVLLPGASGGDDAGSAAAAKEEGEAAGRIEASPLLRQAADVVRGLNPRARVVATRFCECDLAEVINTHRFDFGAVSQGARWQHELLGAMDASAAANRNHIHETEIYGINSLVYTARRPFHPGRLLTWLTRGFEASMRTEPLPASTAAATAFAAAAGVPAVAAGAGDAGGLPAAALPPQLLRSKGFFWLASCPRVCWEWSTAGSASRMSPYGEWVAGKVPRRCWPDEGRRADWDADWGDRGTSLVFIMHGSAELGLIKVGLDACLLTDEELAFPPAAGTNAAADAKDVQQGGGEDGEDGEEEEEEESEDSKWSRREEAWAQLPGAQAWASLLDA